MDQRVTLLLGYLPQELNGTSLYEHIQYDDIPAISECHRNALKSPQEVNIPTLYCSNHHQQVQSPFFRFRAKDGKFVKLESKWKQFRNPWTKEIEYLICKNHMLITRLNMLTITTITIIMLIFLSVPNFLMPALPKFRAAREQILAQGASPATPLHQIISEVRNRKGTESGLPNFEELI